MREMFIRCLRIVGPLRVTKECSHSFAAAPLSVLFATVGSGTVRSPYLGPSLVFSIAWDDPRQMTTPTAQALTRERKFKWPISWSS
jgi:hypothetical protein